MRNTESIIKSVLPYLKKTLYFLFKLDLQLIARLDIDLEEQNVV